MILNMTQVWVKIIQGDIKCNLEKVRDLEYYFKKNY